jgi:uncharacterized Zn-binding protein involved in type VI secretion
MPGQGRLGDAANVAMDTHGCPACPHPAIGPAIQGSPDVNVNRRPALRIDDPGIHAACCGANTWTATAGSATVFINGKGAHRMGDQNRHCGGTGQLAEGSPNVIVGESSTSGGGAGSGMSGGGGGGAGGGGASGGGAGGGGASAGGATSSSADRVPPAGQPAKEKVYMLSRRLVARGATPLREHRIAILDPDTGERVGALEHTDRDGNLFVEVPDHREYDLRVDDDADPVVAPDELERLDMADSELDDAVLTFRLVTPTGVALGNERCDVRAPGGQTFAATTSASGDHARTGDPGVYAVTVRQRTYKVHTLHDSDLDDASPCRLIVR